MSVAENIAAGRTDPWDTINDWWNSPGHQRNMLSDNDHMGVGYQYIHIRRMGIIGYSYLLEDVPHRVLASWMTRIYLFASGG